MGRENIHTYIMKKKIVEKKILVLACPSPSFVACITFKTILRCYRMLLNNLFFNLCSNIARKPVILFLFPPHVDKEVKNVDLCILVSCHKGGTTKA